MAKLIPPPTPEEALGILLRAYAQGRGAMRPWPRQRYLVAGGMGLLHAAGLPWKRASAVNLLAQRTVKAWRKAGEPVSDEAFASAVARLLV